MSKDRPRIKLGDLLVLQSERRKREAAEEGADDTSPSQPSPEQEVKSEVAGPVPVTGNLPVTGTGPVTGREPVTGNPPVSGAPPVTGVAPVTPSNPVTEPSSATPARPATGQSGHARPEYPVTGSAPVTGSPPVTITVEWKRGELRLPNWMVFNLYPHLTAFERAVYQELYLWTHGFKENPRLINQKALAKSLKMDEKTFSKIVGQLEAKSLVRRLTNRVRARNEERGTWMEVLLPRVIGAPDAAGESPVAGNAPATSKAPVTGRTPDHEKEKKKANVKNPLYQIREIGLQLREQHRGQESYGRADLREDVKRQCAEQGIEYSDALIEEALGKVGL